MDYQCFRDVTSNHSMRCFVCILDTCANFVRIVLWLLYNVHLEILQLKLHQACSITSDKINVLRFFSGSGSDAMYHIHETKDGRSSA